MSRENPWAPPPALGETAGSWLRRVVESMEERVDEKIANAIAELEQRYAYAPSVAQLERIADVGAQKNYEGWTIRRKLQGDVVVGKRFFYPGEFNPEAEQQTCYEVGGSTQENPWGGALYPQVVLEQCEDAGLLSPPAAP